MITQILKIQAHNTDIHPCFLARMQVALQLKQGILYQTDQKAFLLIEGASAFICGKIVDISEIDCFLQWLGVKTLQSLEPLQDAKEHVIMRYQPDRIKKLAETPVEIEEKPNLWQLSQSGLLQVEQASYYRTACLRVNQGTAKIFAIKDKDTYCATAGAYAITKQAAYITGVATAAYKQKQGYASCLLHTLCTKLKERAIYLICEKELCAFYEKIGFQAECICYEKTFFQEKQEIDKRKAIHDRTIF